MFFWGSYNFQAPQLAENDNKPPLRFPVYMPPTPATLSAPSHARGSGSHATNLYALKAGDVELHSALHDICDSELRVKHVACGLKHMVAVLGVPKRHALGDGAAAAATSQQEEELKEEGGVEEGEEEEVVVGLGSNHNGQLGQRVATYANTFTNLRVDEVMEGDVVSIVCGARHTLLCTSKGCVYVSGDNSCGQLGLSSQMMLAAASRAHQSGGGGGAVGEGSTTSGSAGAGSGYIAAFTQLPALVHIRKVFANGNASFALDARGHVYSWGEAQYGHLGHNDNGERMDPKTMKIVTQHVRAPQLIRWFERQRVAIVDVAVGKAHMVCRSEEDVYTCGEGFFGKLGHGDVASRLEPVRVEFPPRKQTEKLVDIAAGDDHTIVLKLNPVIGSIIYYFGKLSNSDGQLTPIIVPVAASSLTRVVAGKGNMSMCISEEGTLYVWGKHSYQKVYNGTNATAPRNVPSPVEVLSPFVVDKVAIGGTFVIACASGKRKDHEDDEEERRAAWEVRNSADVIKVEAAGSAVDHHDWDVVVPHDARVSRHNPEGDVEEIYEEGRRLFMHQYLGEALGEAYVRDLPSAPAKTEAPTYQYTKIASANLAVGQKVRLWMTDVYALGKITKVMNDGDATQTDGECAHRHSAGRRVSIEWERDDWKDEMITLYSDDETYDEENMNRWQPFWFEQNAAGVYVVHRSNKKLGA